MRFAGCFTSGAIRALGRMSECDWLELRMVPDPDDPRYEAMLLEGVKPSGATVVYRVKEKRDGRSPGKSSNSTGFCAASSAEESDV